MRVSDDLLVSLEYGKFARSLEHLEGRVTEMIACRHDYPVWPSHGDNPQDAYEEEFHTLVRHQYYTSVKYLIQALRVLRELS